MLKPILASLLSVFIFSSHLYAQDYSAPFMPDSEDMKVTTSLHRTSKQLSSVSIGIRKDGDLFKITKKGQGHIDRQDNASWIINATLRDNNGFLETLDSVCHIKDKEGETLSVYKKLYDHKEGMIRWESYGKNGKLIKSAAFPIKGKTCDDTTLMFFLKSFMPDQDRDGQYFYLLTNEPKLFKTKIKFLGTEKLNLPFGEVEAIKIKLTADIGILDDVLDRFVPKTYMWYSKDPPYTWLKYQGFEKDSGSHYVVNLLEEIIPAPGL